MKVIINKIGREYPDTTEIMQSINALELPDGYYVKENKYEHYDLAYYCTNCGCHLEGIWKTNYLGAKQRGPSYNHSLREREIKTCEKVEEIIRDWNERNHDIQWEANIEELSELARLTRCPVCGAELNRDRDHFFASVCSNPKGDPLLENLQISRRDYHKIYLPRALQKEKEDLEKKAEQFAMTCDIPAASMVSANEAESIRSSLAGLKEYLNHLIELEMDIYSITSRLKALYVQQTDSYRKVVVAEKLPLFTLRNEIETAEALFQLKIVKAKQYMQGETGIALPEKPIPPTFATPNFFNKKKVLAENEALQARYQAELRDYKMMLKQCEDEKEYMIFTAKEEARQAKATVEARKAELSKLEQNRDSAIPARTAKKIVDMEIKIAEDSLRKLYECRNKLYSYNIVFGKYRNAVALSTFYEYLMAGRCTSLEGTDGAYNLYESEIRANTIIGQLSQVISKLDEIKDAQYMICSQLRSVNQSLTHLNQTMDSALTSVQNIEQGIANISQNAEVIAHNSALTAYYSKVNAELTNAMGFMMTYK